jgi:hypothetical protein
LLDSGGNTKFFESLSRFKLEKTFRGIKQVLVVADNDEDPQGRFDNIRTQLERVFGTGSAPPAPLEKTKGTPSLSVLMIPWTDQHGHLEKLCCVAAKTADKKIGAHVDHFMALLNSDGWTDSRIGKAWLRTNLAARCERDPFVPLGTVFDDNRYNNLIPLNDPSLNQVANFLASFS